MSGFLDFLLKTRSQANAGDIAKAGFPEFGGEALNAAHIYPSDLFTPGVEPYMLFFVREGVAADAKVKTRLALYMPATISVAYGAQYQEIEMTIQQYEDLAKDTFGATQAAATGNTGDLLKKNAATRATLGQGAANLVDYKMKTNFGQQYQKLIGQTVNPHMSLLFKGMDLRTFGFSFQMMARNKQETENIQNIIKTFKMAMHPGSEDGSARWLNYPDNFNIGLFSPANKYLFNFNTCVLTGMDVNYAGSGIPSFFTGTGAPVDLRMNLTFKELSIVTRDDIEHRDL